MSDSWKPDALDRDVFSATLQVRRQFERAQEELGIPVGDRRVLPQVVIGKRSVPVFDADHQKVIGQGKMIDEETFEFLITDPEVIAMLRGDPMRNCSIVQPEGSVSVTPEGEVLWAHMWPKEAKPNE